MFKNDIFIQDTMKNIYGVENPENHNFSGTKDYPKISDDDYKILDAYIEQTQNIDRRIKFTCLWFQK